MNDSKVFKKILKVTFFWFPCSSPLAIGWLNWFYDPPTLHSRRRASSDLSLFEFYPHKVVPTRTALEKLGQASFHKYKQVPFTKTNKFCSYLQICSFLQTFDVSYVPPVQFPIQNEDVSKCIKACNVAHVWLLPSLINLIQLNPTFMPMSTNATRESEGSKDCRKLERDEIKDQSFVENLKRYGCEMCG